MPDEVADAAHANEVVGDRPRLMQRPLAGLGPAATLASVGARLALDTGSASVRCTAIGDVAGGPEGHEYGGGEDQDEHVSKCDDPP